MKRREFLKSSLTAASAGALTSALSVSAADAPEKPAREFYELRLYHLRRGPKQKLFDDFYREAALPALGRAGIGPVGVFGVATGPESPTMYVLMPHKSIESFATASERVHADPDYVKAGAEFINAPAGDPSYVRVESSLMVAFEGCPKSTPPLPVSKTSPVFSSCAPMRVTAKKQMPKKSRCLTRRRSPSSAAMDWTRFSLAKH
jgi:hypothetical protein